MITNLKFEPCSIQYPTYINMDMFGVSFPVCLIDKDSFIVNATIEAGVNLHFGDQLYNFQIGRYSSVAEDILLLIDVDHDLYSVYQGVISEFTIQRNMPPLASPPKKRNGEILIGNDCWIGNGATILNGTIIHDGAVVAAKSVVTKSVPPYSIVGGNPAKIIKKRFDDETINALQKIQWWNWQSDKLISEFENMHGDINTFIRRHLSEAEVELAELSKRNPFFERTVSDGKVYAYIVDYEAPVSSYPQIIQKFCSRFHNMDSQLVMFFPGDISCKELALCSVKNELKKYEELDCCIDLVTDSSATLEAILLKCDAYITSRSTLNIKAITIANLYGKDIVSGFSLPMYS